MLARARAVDWRWGSEPWASATVGVRSLSDKKRRTLKKDRSILLHRKRDLDDQDPFLLSTWTENYPQPGQAYELSESFFDIWDETPTSRQPGPNTKPGKRASPPTWRDSSYITTAVENWKEPIFNYFDTRVTNAYTEALNGVMKVVNRNGRGYSFEAIRAKMLYAEAHMYRKRPYGKSWQAEKPAGEQPPIAQSEWVGDTFVFALTPDEYQAFLDWFNSVDNLGVPLSTFDLEFDQEPNDDESTIKSG